MANGDIRCNLGRATLPRSSVHETVVDLHGYQPERDFPPQTHLDYGSPGVPRAECTPKHCTYTPPITARPTYGITHPNYHTSTKSVPTSAVGSPYPDDRHEYVAQQREYTTIYPPEQCSFPGTYEPRGPCLATTCSDCPGGPCEYRHGGHGLGAPCYTTTTSECQQRTDLGPPPDIHPEVRTSDIRLPPDVHRDVPSELRPECYDSRTVRSHHASHCDLREFQEWRDLRGSRESVGTLPPELESHLKECRCPCDHLGYGNYQVSGSL